MIQSVRLNENFLNSASSQTGIDSKQIESLISDLAPQLLNKAKANLDEVVDDLLGMGKKFF